MRFLAFVASVFLCHILHSACAFENAPEKLGFSGEDFVYLVFEEANRDDFWRLESPIDPILKAFENWASANVESLDPYYLLQRQRKIFAMHVPERVESFDLLISGKVGAIRGSKCLERLLFAEHAKRTGVGPVLSEFKAAIVYNPLAHRSLKIYFASSRIQNGTAPPFKEMEPLIKRDLANGYRFLFDMHNHPFDFSNPSGDIAGTTIPSDPDITVLLAEAAQSGLEGAVITNGISSLYLESREFSALRLK